MEEIKIVIDQDTLDRYNKFYFHRHPKAKKIPIEKPRHPSINEWFILPRPQMNALKQKWKDFGYWLIQDLGYENKKLENFTIAITVYFENRIRRDVDNQVPKFLLDAFTTSGFIVDDDMKHLKSLTLSAGYDPGHPRTEIIVSLL